MLNVRGIVFCAMFAALTAVLSQIALPIGPVPLNLATFAVVLAGALLGPKLGALSMLVWVLLGICGVPVFSFFSSGIGIVLGPTGGFIMGFAPAAFTVGLLCNLKAITRPETGKPFLYISRYALAMAAGALVYFTAGTLWFMYVTGNTPAQTLMLCVVPFLPGDLLKILVAAIITHRVKGKLGELR
jgi:biotin transport system substrate-specific component